MAIGEKKIYESKSVIGAVLTLLAAIIGIWGYTFTPADQEATLRIITSFGALVSAALSIYGRVVAKDKIE